ncbi:MAG TPA: pitrilysin family protein [Longimicrobiales bacterium]|nr:pitrilysin family protein [Longimicrobiales bacterium]
MEIHIPYTTFTLPNGLRVFVHEDTSVPLVSVNLWYHVGSKDERPGRTGFAHLFEHLMFEGSAHAPAGEFDNLLESAGGVNNGSTSPDRTNYWETLPSDALALAFWLESDRMGWLAMSQETLDTQRDVVINERRQSYENRPYGMAYETVLAALYPPEHPYNWPVIGHVKDLESATLEDVRAFFTTYYAPNNATLAVAGHTTATAVEELAHRYFGEIPAGPPVPPVAAPPAPIEADRRLVLEDRVRLPRLYLAWHSPPQFAPGDAALETAAAILADGKASRLYRSLVYERQVAQDVDAFQDGGLLGSTFEVAVTARPGVGLEELEAAVREELRRIAREGVEAAELDRARNRIETAFVDALQHAGGFGGKADRMNEYFFYTGDPGYADADLRRFLELTPDAVQAAVAEHLADSGRVILSVVPKGRPELAAGGAA